VSIWFHGKPSPAVVSFATVLVLGAITATAVLVPGWGGEIRGSGAPAHILAVAFGVTMLRNGIVGLVHPDHEVDYKDSDGRTRYSKLGRGGAISFVVIGGAVYVGLTFVAVLA
jgi:hypothetical protein